MIVAVILLATFVPLTVYGQGATEPGADPFNRNGQAEPGAPGAEPAAHRLPQIPDTPEGIIEALGWEFVIPFTLASIVAVWISIERMVVLRRGRVIPRPFVERFLQHLQAGQLDPPTALHLCEQSGSPVAAVFAHGIRKWGKPSVEVEQAIIDGGERQVSQLRKHLRILNGVSTLTPLLGLLGTVLGMIQSFNHIATADPSQKSAELAMSIGLALLTTAVGLIISIPALVMYMYLSGKVDSLVIDMDDLAQNVVHLISAEALASQMTEDPAARTAARKKPTTTKTA